MKFFTEAIKRMARATYQDAKKENVVNFVEKTVCGRPVPSENQYDWYVMINSTPRRWKHIRDEESKINAIKMAEKIKKDGGHPEIEIHMETEEKATWTAIETEYKYIWRTRDVSSEIQNDASKPKFG